MNVYLVGMGSDTTEIASPNAVTAAFYYGVNLINTNAPSMVAVYKENGHEWNGQAYWMGLGFLSEEKAQPILERIMQEIDGNIECSGEMMWWCPRDGSDPVYGWHGMIYRGRVLSEQSDFATRDESKALRHTLQLARLG